MAYTPQDWEETLLKNWAKIDNIINRFIGKANFVYSVFAVPGPRGNLTVEQDLKECLEYKNYQRILKYMKEAWWRAPDSPSIQEIPGWGIFCDLISEGDRP